MTSTILLPAALLVIWTLIMLFWMAATRLPAASKLGVDVAGSVGGRGTDLDAQLEPSIAWKSHNHTHLHEQPTLFYAIVLILFALGANTETNIALAWAYVVLRVLHSLWQVLVNKVSVRFVLFLLSTFCLLALAINAVRIML